LQEPRGCAYKRGINNPSQAQPVFAKSAVLNNKRRDTEESGMHATEISFCFEGGGTMRTPGQTIAGVPGAFVVHPPGEVHEYENGPQRTLLFRVRYGADMVSRHVTWRGHPGWTQSAEDAAYYKKHPVTFSGA
jgi:hypothetical protein